MNTSSGNVVPLRKSSTKSAEKKRELALHAISSLAELGFARMNLRDVAHRSGVSLGVIHYYFESKTELLIYCISIYKEDFISNLKKLIAEASDQEQLRHGLANNLATTVAQQAHLHRLWYDVRAQAMFDAAFQVAIEEVEHGLIDIFQKLLDKLATLAIPCREEDPLKLYITLDGWFRYYLQRQLQGDASAVEAFRERVYAEFAQLVIAR